MIVWNNAWAKIPDRAAGTENEKDGCFGTSLYRNTANRMITNISEDGKYLSLDGKTHTKTVVVSGFGIERTDLGYTTVRHYIRCGFCSIRPESQKLTLLSTCNVSTIQGSGSIFHVS